MELYNKGGQAHMLILQLLLFTVSAAWGYNYIRATTSTPEAPQRPPEELPEEMPPAPPKMDRRQLEKIAASCLYRLLTPTERENINIFSFCRDASDTELKNIIERFKNDF